jgi:hypothetical protein
MSFLRKPSSAAARARQTARVPGEQNCRRREAARVSLDSLRRALVGFECGFLPSSFSVVRTHESPASADLAPPAIGWTVEARAKSGGGRSLSRGGEKTRVVVRSVMLSYVAGDMCNGGGAHLFRQHRSVIGCPWCLGKSCFLRAFGQSTYARQARPVRLLLSEQVYEQLRQPQFPSFSG